MVGAQLVVAEAERVLADRGSQHLDGFGDDLGANPVPGDHGDGGTSGRSSHGRNPIGGAVGVPADLTRERRRPATTPSS